MQSPLKVANQSVKLPLLRKKRIQLSLKRLDQIHPEVSGNKWYKLKYNIREAIRQGHTQVLTFGGAFSNHIYATAATSRLSGIQSIGLIRGDKSLSINPTLSFAETAGMKLHFLSRPDYRQKDSPETLKMLEEKHGRFYLIPEGGTNALAIKGTGEILQDHDAGFDFICLSIGTGGTFAGILSSAYPFQKVLGFSSLKGAFIHNEVELLLHRHGIIPVCTYEIFDQYHFGGYAKSNDELIAFLHSFTDHTGIPLDPVYTGKMMYGILDLIQRDKIPENSKILALHSGGLQGIKGFNSINGTKLPFE